MMRSSKMPPLEIDDRRKSFISLVSYWPVTPKSHSRRQLLVAFRVLAIMFRLTRPLFQHALKASTGITGLKVHPNPLPTLTETYQATLARLNEIPQTSVYRQGVEALTQRKLNIVQGANGDVSAAEKALDEGQIEESIDIAQDELSLVGKMIEWKA